ncbi:MAG: ABC transporter substrate-binding protein [Deltaproteobacteria bacterium]|nr:ABC transporter substrate-binding protein [Deltaproteobacteria bacterium]
MIRHVRQGSGRAGARAWALALGALALGAVLVAGDAWAQARDKVSFRMAWILYGQTPSYYYGKEKGFFLEEGIDLTILEGQGSATTVKLVAAGTDTFGSADYGTMAKGIAQGIPVKGIFGILQTHPMGVATSQELGVRRPQDLVGKSVAVAAGGGDQQVLPAFLAANGLTGRVKVVQLSSGAAKREAILARRVDGIVAYANEQVPQIEAAGMKLNYLPFAEHGVRLLGMGILANTKTLKEKPELTRRFLRGMARSLLAAQRDPEGAVGAALKVFRERDRAVTLKELTLSFPLYHTPNTAGKPLGWMARQDWETNQEILLKYGGQEKRLPIEDYFTNEFIADVK